MAEPASNRNFVCLRFLVVVAVTCMCSARILDAHDENAPAFPCKTDPKVPVEAAFKPGIITLDGDSKDWADVEAQQFTLLPALTPSSSKKFPMEPGSIQIKAVHDGRDVFFNVELPGDYVYKDGEATSCPAVALMFGVGDDATYYNMGGCRQGRSNCSTESCHGHEVDIMQFAISTAIPGRLYGSNLLDNVGGTGNDRFGNLKDLFAWSPHCVYADGTGPDAKSQGLGAQNDWRGAWSHTSISLQNGLLRTDSPFGSDGSAGFFIFEFARPLRTNDRFQQDVQFTIGDTVPFAAAVWYPLDKTPWEEHEHYSANCDWIKLKLSPGGTGLTSLKTVDILSIFSITVSLAALGTTLVLGWWLKTSSVHIGFQGVPNL